MIQKAEQKCHVDRIDIDVDREALEEAERRFLYVTGMGCPTCATRVHNALLGVPGVLAVDVDLDSGMGEVWLDGLVSTDALLDAVIDAGSQTQHRYRAVPVRSG